MVPALAAFGGVLVTAADAMVAALGALAGVLGTLGVLRLRGAAPPDGSRLR